MIREVLSKFPFSLMPTIVMFVFVIFFLSMLFWLYRRGSSDFYKKVEQIPFREDGGDNE